MRSATSKKRSRSAFVRPIRWMTTSLEVELKGDAGASDAGDPDEADLAPDFFEGLERPDELGARMRRHQRSADQGPARRRRRREDAVDEHALLLQPVNHPERRQVLADHDGND